MNCNVQKRFFAFIHSAVYLAFRFLVSFNLTENKRVYQRARRRDKKNVDSRNSKSVCQRMKDRVVKDEESRLKKYSPFRLIFAFLKKVRAEKSGCFDVKKFELDFMYTLKSIATIHIHSWMLPHTHTQICDGIYKMLGIQSKRTKSILGKKIKYLSCKHV